MPENGKWIKSLSSSTKTQYLKIGKVKFVVNILAGTGEFEIRQNDVVLVTGFIKILSTDDQMQLPELKAYEVDQLSTADVYQDLACKGYKYNKSFQGINLASNNGTLYFYNVWKTN